MRTQFLPFATPCIGEEEINEVTETLRSGWLTAGHRVERFERDFQDFIGCKHALAVSSGTAALHLSLQVLQIGAGDEVITTPYTFASTANVIELQGATPVFADIDESTLNIKPKNIEAKITSHTKAIIPVHLAGYPCQLDQLGMIAKTYRIPIIEDATHALGAVYQDTMIGADSDFAAFSFYPIKNMTAAEGGMLVTNNAEWAREVKILRWYGLSEALWERESQQDFNRMPLVLRPGFKYNMSDVQAAIGVHQLKKLQRFNARREHYFQMYLEELSDLREIQLPVTANDCSKSAYHLFIIRLHLERLRIDQAQFRKALSDYQIGSSFHYPSLHLHPYYKKKFHFKPTDFPVANKVSQEAVSLPLYPKLCEQDVEDVIYAVRQIIKKYTR